MHVEVVGLGDSPARAVDYLEAWDLQRTVHAEVVEGTRPDTVLLLEHPPTYTAGKRTDPHERPLDPGGPLAPGEYAYADAVDADHAVNAGGLLTDWTPFSHEAYWESPRVLDAAADQIAAVARAAV